MDKSNTKLDHTSIGNDNIREEANIKPIETFLEIRRVQWFGHCLRLKEFSRDLCSGVATAWGLKNSRVICVVVWPLPKS